MEIIPSINGATLAEFEDQARAVGLIAPILHLDVRDGNFVTERSPDDFGQVINPDLRYDVHFMHSDPQIAINQLPKLAVRYCFIHAEVEDAKLDAALDALDKRGIAAGLALKLKTPLGKVAELERSVQAVLLMATQPGPSGNPFQSTVVPRITHLKEHFAHLYVCVDGGISSETITDIKQADGAVVHTALFQQSRPIAQIYTQLCALAS